MPYPSLPDGDGGVLGWRGHVSRPALADVRGRSRENFLYEFQGDPKGPLAPPPRPPGRRSRLWLPLLPALGRLLARRDRRRAAFAREEARSRGDLIRGPLAAAPIGLTGRAGKHARSRASVRAAAPVSNRFSLVAELPLVVSTAKTITPLVSRPD
jgi:hypothetical protein